MFLHRLTVLFIAGSTLAASAQDGGLFCSGQGRMVTGNVTGYFPSHVYTVPNSAADDPAGVEVVECGRAIVVSVQGHRLSLSPLAVGGGWSGTMTIEGFTTEVNLERAGPRMMVGTMVSLGGGGTLRTNVRLIVTEARAPRMEGCSDDPPEALPARGTSLAHAALADALSDRPLPDGHAFGDFISPGVISENGGTESVHVMLSGSGDLLPLAPPELTADEICAGQTGYREPPQQMLNFKIMRFEGGTTVFVQRIDIKNGKIVQQHEAVAAREDQAAVTTAMQSALAMLAEPVGAFSDGVN